MLLCGREIPGSSSRPSWRLATSTKPTTASRFTTGMIKIALIEERALRELRKSERLQIYREDIISRYSLRGTFSAFKNSRVSAVELAVIKLDELERKELRHLERKEWSAEAHRQKRAAWADAILNTKGREEHGEDQ